MKLITAIGTACLLAAGNAFADTPSASPDPANPNAIAQSSQPLNGATKKDAQAHLNAFLISKKVKARIDFPAFKDGVDLSPAGLWSVNRNAQLIKEHGVGIMKGDPTTITAVKVKDDTIEIHLDGGGAGIFSEGFGPDPAKEQAKAPGGSRINLRFDRPITAGDTQDFLRFLSYLEPVVDTADLQKTARQQMKTAPAEATPEVAGASLLPTLPLLEPTPKAAPKAAPAPKAEAASKVTPKTTTVPMGPAAQSVEEEPKATIAPPPAATPAPAPAAAKAATAPAKAAPAAAAPPPSTPAAPPKADSSKITVGMERSAVYALVGQPAYKRVDASKAVPVERWQFDLPGNHKRIITFENGKVTSIQDF
jgi:hypothetical protein